MNITDPEVIAVAGDWHNDTRYAKDALEAVAEAGVSHVVHTGDFGFWARESGFILTLEKFLKKRGMHLFWVDGNHEGHDALDELPVDPATGFRPITPSIWHVPRGHRWEWGGFTWMGLGGAASVDRYRRVEGFDWFPQEVLSDEDVAHAARPGHVDVMVTHDAPYNVSTLRARYRGEIAWPAQDLQRSHCNQELLEWVVKQVGPSYLFHGHHHLAYSEDFGPTRVVGLDCNTGPLSSNLRFVDPAGHRVY